MGLLSKQQLRQFIKENDFKSPEDIPAELKEVFASTMQEMLEAELESHLATLNTLSRIRPQTIVAMVIAARPSHRSMARSISKFPVTAKASSSRSSSKNIRRIRLAFKTRLLHYMPAV